MPAYLALLRRQYLLHRLQGKQKLVPRMRYLPETPEQVQRSMPESLFLSNTSIALCKWPNKNPVLLSGHSFCAAHLKGLQRTVLFVKSAWLVDMRHTM
jgi:hypothetical protein